jgi:hypothetical protein
VEDDVEHADHVRAVQPRSDPAFSQNALTRLLDRPPTRAGEDGKQLLHRDRAAQQLVDGPPHRPHGADTHELLEAIAIADPHRAAVGRAHRSPRRSLTLVGKA